MARHDPRIRLQHMRDYAEEAIKLSVGKSRADLDDDRVLSLALVRLCELIGQAASKVAPETRQGLSEIPWAQIVSFRNRLIHGYDSLDLDIVWQVLTGDLPPLLATLQKILSDRTE